MKRWLILLLLVLLVFVGCGGTSKPNTKFTPPVFVCHHKEPAQMGECIRQELEAHPKALTLAPPTASLRAQGVDISRWQPHPRFRELRAEGISFVIVQAADNDHESNPFLVEQVRGAHAAGLKVGVYVFAEGASSTSQGAALIVAVRPIRSLISLGAFVDAEVSPAYARACGIASVLSHSFFVVGVYGSPGTYRGGRCVGVQWPAEWGFGRATPLPSYPSSSIRLRQWCGTCRLGGNDGEIDRDEDLGVIALSHVETPEQKTSRVKREREARLQADYHERRGLNGELAKLNCLHGYDHYTRAHKARCTELRHRHGINSRDLKRLHGLGI